MVCKVYRLESITEGSFFETFLQMPPIVQIQVYPKDQNSGLDSIDESVMILGNGNYVRSLPNGVACFTHESASLGEPLEAFQG